MAWLGNTPPTSAIDYEELDGQTLSLVRRLLAESDSAFNQVADLRYANGGWRVWLAGRRNHHGPTIVELFRAIARTGPGSYGILYTFDDEASEGWDRWIMRRGNVHKSRDEDLTPHVGMVEEHEELDV